MTRKIPQHIFYNPIKITDPNEFVTLESVSPFHNAHIMPLVEKLFHERRDQLFDDFDGDNSGEQVETVYKLAADCYPYFLAGFYKGEFGGVIYFDGFKGNKDRYHSCNLHLVSTKGSEGKHTRIAISMALNFMFGIVKRIQAVVLLENKLANLGIKNIGFIHEGVLRSVTTKKGKFMDANIYGLLKKEYKEIKRGKYGRKNT